MGSSAKITKSITIANKPYQEVTQVVADAGAQVAPSGGVPAAASGTLTTRTDNETGTITGTTGHGITTGAVIDIFWDGGARFGVLVGTVSGNSIPIGADNSGTGSNLPTASTVVKFMVPHEESLVVSAGAIRGITVYSQRVGRIAFLESDGTPIVAYDLTAGQTKVPYLYGDGQANPIGENIGKVAFSHSYSDGVAVMEAGVIRI